VNTLMWRLSFSVYSESSICMNARERRVTIEMADSSVGELYPGCLHQVATNQENCILRLISTNQTRGDYYIFFPSNSVKNTNAGVITSSCLMFTENDKQTRHIPRTRATGSSEAHLASLQLTQPQPNSTMWPSRGGWYNSVMGGPMCGWIILWCHRW